MLSRFDCIKKVCLLPGEYVKDTSAGIAYCNEPISRGKTTPIKGTYRMNSSRQKNVTENK